MKIGIFTQPLIDNYGNLLQAYALQTMLMRMGHEVVVINRCSDYSKWTLLRIILWRIYHNLTRNKSYPIFKDYPTMNNLAKIRELTDGFILRNINSSGPIFNNDKLKEYTLKNKFDAYVVGSDQVWRPCYSPNLYTYFLDFASDDVKKIAYAASFGTDSWEFTPEQTEHCANLLKRFDAISVREESAVNLCSKYFNRDDVQCVLDPTLLLSKDDYIGIVEKQGTPKSNGELLIYLLDISEEKQKIVEIVTQEKKIIPFSVRKKANEYNGGSSMNDCIQPAVETWLRGFMDAKYVVTDSFHGCVFAIIFNKPFLVIGNQVRGIARFHSLLKRVGLETRLVNSHHDVTAQMINTPIDWERVNSRIKELKIRSKEFLNKALS